MLNWLVIGIGDVTSRRVIPAILAEPRSRLSGLLTRNPAKAGAWPAATIFTELDAALAEPAIDAVYVASPVALHVPQSIAALRAGKHVLCEKPVALNYPEALALADAAATAPGICGVAYYRRLFPKLIRAKRSIAAGDIGQPVLAEANCHTWLDAGIRESPRAWFLDPAMAGGGPLYDIASHRIDAFNFLFGRPVRATGLLSNVIHRLDVEDTATAIIDYEDQVRGIVDVRWNTRVTRDEFRITGTEGEINLSPLSADAGHHNVHYPLIADFVSAVLERRPPACPLAEAILTDRVTSLVAACHQV
jgi:predicted dehydrogenase